MADRRRHPSSPPPPPPRYCTDRRRQHDRSPSPHPRSGDDTSYHSSYRDEGSSSRSRRDDRHDRAGGGEGGRRDDRDHRVIIDPSRRRDERRDLQYPDDRDYDRSRGEQQHSARMYSRHPDQSSHTQFTTMAADAAAAAAATSSAAATTTSASAFAPRSSGMRHPRNAAATTTTSSNHTPNHKRARVVPGLSSSGHEPQPLLPPSPLLPPPPPPLIIDLTQVPPQQHPQYRPVVTTDVTMSAASLQERIDANGSVISKHMDIQPNALFNFDSFVSEVTTSTSVNSPYVLKYTNVFVDHPQADEEEAEQQDMSEDRQDQHAAAAASRISATTSTPTTTSISTPTTRSVIPGTRDVMLDMPRKASLLMDLLIASHHSATSAAAAVGGGRGGGGAPEVTVTRLCTWWVQLLLGLRAIHDARILHNDIKTSNIMWEGLTTDRACIIDFGLARACHGDTSVAFTLDHSLCSRHFRAPEIWQRHAYGYPSDVYALGLVFFQLMFARPQLRLIDLNEVVAPAKTGHKDTDRHALFQAERASFKKQVHRFQKLKSHPLIDTADDTTWFLFGHLARLKIQDEAFPCDLDLQRQLIGIIGSMVVFDPVQRATIHQILAHPLLAPIAQRLSIGTPQGAAPGQPHLSVSTTSSTPRRNSSSIQHQALRELWQQAIACSFPLNSTLVAAHMLTRLTFGRRAQGERSTPATAAAAVATATASAGDDHDLQLNVAACLVLSARLHGHTHANIHLAAHVARRHTPIHLVYEHEWVVLFQLDGALLRGFDATRTLAYVASSL